MKQVVLLQFSEERNDKIQITDSECSQLCRVTH